MLKITRIELELLSDENIHNFILSGIRGGIVQCCKRHSIANNKYLSDYNVTKLSHYLIYLGVNNLYGYAMSQYTPHNNFECIKNVKEFNVFSIPEDSLVGYILEVDLDYPIAIHNTHNDFPFCFENKKVGSMKHIKLIGDLTSKIKYIIHYKNLQQCIKHGLILRKIYRILKFNQSYWLKKYTDLNNYHRTIAANKFEENFFKLLNNAVYGKTMENVDKRINVKLEQDWENTNIGGRRRRGRKK
ncbi:unnamed protein product [Ceratitis capitata]|uniref:(Mediterranean fruit fly) hypothetical protein n=1 Tax=Ceratitis capitata TaxID=7213 RepID=A0A811VB03_CERCA|nr:unnamed protein product [Ceratitis capitata]